MNKKVVFKELLLIIATIILGGSFVFQNMGMKYIGPFTFNVLRCFLGALFLLLVIFVKWFGKRQNIFKEINIKKLCLGGLIIGLTTAAGMACQQKGIQYETVGKSGFITTLYIVFVPIIEIFLRKRPSLFTFIGIICAVIGLYLINMNGQKFVWGIGCWYLLGCAFFYALQIIFISIFSKYCEAIQLTFVQFFVAGLLQLPFMFILESNCFASINQVILPLLYVGILSSGITFAIQIYAQKDVAPSITSVILSLESVFALIFGAIFLQERHGVLEIIGCFLILIAIILSQVHLKEKKEVDSSTSLS